MPPEHSYNRSEADAKEYLTQTLSVSRETLERLQIYHDLLLKWQASINLISPTTLPQIWSRHILDSAQLFPLIDQHSATIVDVGSGAGFPGMVVAIMGCSQLHLVESDKRKTIFLSEAARVTNTALSLHKTRVETLHIAGSKIITARACASIRNLLECVKHLVEQDTRCILLKGGRWQEELLDAQTDWAFEYKTHPSVTDPTGVIISLSQIVDKRHDTHI